MTLKQINLKGGIIMLVSLSELKANVGKYVGLAEVQDIFITKNGKMVAKIVSTKIDKIDAMKRIFGIIPSDIDLDVVKTERLK